MDAVLPNFILYLVFALAIAGLIYTRLAMSAQERFMRGMATVFNYLYSKNAEITSVSGALFNMGKYPELNNVISGTRNGRVVRIYNYSTVVGAGDMERTLFYSVFEHDYDFTLPHIILTHISDMSIWNDKNHPHIENGVTLTLEGGFSEKYELQTEKFFEIEAYQIFTPDVMQKFLDQKQEIHLEAHGRKLYLFHDKLIQEKGEMDSFLALGDMINELLARHFKGVSASTVAMEEVKKV